MVLSCRGSHAVFSLQICLQVKGKGDALASFDGFFDLPEQSIIREDCKQLVGT